MLTVDWLLRHEESIGIIRDEGGRTKPEYYKIKRGVDNLLGVCVWTKLETLYNCEKFDGKTACAVVAEIYR